MRLLCISDIHGHAKALDRVLAVGRAQECTKILVAGDLCFPGPEPLITWKLLMASRAQCVQGVSDRALARIDPDRLNPTNDLERERVERLRSIRQELGEVILARLDRLPPTFRMATEDGGEILLVHGSPEDPTVSMTEDMTDAELSALLGDDPADVVVCGGSHSPFDRVLGTTRIVNVGSVGEAPAGFAHATIMTTSPVGIEVQPMLIPLGSSEEVSEGQPPAG